MKGASPTPMRGGFILLESLLAVFIFSIAALGLAKCVQNCLRAESFRREEALAQRALANYWAQLEANAIPMTSESASEELKGAWAGMKLNITKEPMKYYNEKEQEIFGIYKMTLTLTWGKGQEQQVRTMEFLSYPRTR